MKNGAQNSENSARQVVDHWMTRMTFSTKQQLLLQSLCNTLALGIVWHSLLFFHMKMSWNFDRSFRSSMTQMTSLMHSLCASTCKASVAILALERFGTGVNIFMLAQLGIVSEAFAAYITLEFSIVDGSVFAVHVPRHFPSSHHFTTFRTWNFDMDPINMFFQIIWILESSRTMWAN